jgi:hypothetical protein
MVLQGTVRRRQVIKQQCWAERWHGDAQAACIVLRGTVPLTSLAYEVSPPTAINTPMGETRGRRPPQFSGTQGRGRSTCLPRPRAGEPQSVEGTASTTPSTPSCVSPAWDTRESLPRDVQEGGEEAWGDADETPRPSRQSKRAEESECGKPAPMAKALRERVGKQDQGPQRTRQAVHGACPVELAQWTLPIISLAREP